MIGERRSMHMSIWLGSRRICASWTAEIIIGWVGFTIMPWLLAPIDTKQIDCSFKESKINHFPRCNRVLEKNNMLHSNRWMRIKKFYRRIFTNIFAASKSNVRLINETGRNCVSFGDGDLKWNNGEVKFARMGKLIYSTCQWHRARTRPSWEPSLSTFSRIICLALGTISKIDCWRVISVTKSDPPVL